MTSITVRPGVGSDRILILSLADRLAFLGPSSRTATEIVGRERRALAEALEHSASGSTLLVAESVPHGLVGVMLLESRRDYFTDKMHGHVAILAVAKHMQGQGVGRQQEFCWGRQ